MGRLQAMIVLVSLFTAAAGVCCVGSICLWFRLRVDKRQRDAKEDFGQTEVIGESGHAGI